MDSGPRTGPISSCAGVTAAAGVHGNREPETATLSSALWSVWGQGRVTRVRAG
jgi:hypothetical protein